MKVYGMVNAVQVLLHDREGFRGLQVDWSSQYIVHAVKYGVTEMLEMSRIWTMQLFERVDRAQLATPDQKEKRDLAILLMTIGELLEELERQINYKDGR